MSRAKVLAWLLALTLSACSSSSGGRARDGSQEGGAAVDAAADLAVDGTGGQKDGSTVPDAGSGGDGAVGQGRLGAAMVPGGTFSSSTSYRMIGSVVSRGTVSRSTNYQLSGGVVGTTSKP